MVPAFRIKWVKLRYYTFEGCKIKWLIHDRVCFNHHRAHVE